MKEMRCLERPVSSILVLAFFSMLVLASLVSVHYDGTTNNTAAIGSMENATPDVSMVEAGFFGKLWKFIKRVANCVVCLTQGSEEACKRCRGESSSSSGR